MPDDGMPKGVRIYGVLLILYGLYNLVGLGSYGQFSMMFRPLVTPVVIAIYGFTALYGICGVYCGIKILRLEDWARRLMVVMTAVSVTVGLLLNRLVMGNFMEFLAQEASQVPPDMAGSVYRFAVILTVLVTLFELSIIYYFTRPGITRQFS